MQSSNQYKNHFTATAIMYNLAFKLMPPGWGSQQILSAPSQPTWGTNNTLIQHHVNKMQVDTST